MSPCWKCPHKGTIPGNVHIFCKLAFGSSDNPLAGVFQILGSVGRTPLPGANKEHDVKPEFRPRLWPGCGAWPACYDSNIVIGCSKMPEGGETDGSD